jgi:dienelactone hydrolase
MQFYGTVLGICLIPYFFYAQQQCAVYNFVEYCLVDQSRLEVYPHIQKHPYRELLMHVWIPREDEHKRYPLLLFSHGLGPIYNGKTYIQLCQTLTQRGYVVASVSHTYACKPLPSLSDGTMYPYLFPVHAVHYQHGKHMFDIETEIWVADMQYALDECLRYNTIVGNQLYNTIDSARIGIIGHSLGGSTAVQMGRRDSRIRVVVNLDGPLYGENALQPFAKPMLFIFGSSVVPGMHTAFGVVPRHAAFMWRQYFNDNWLPILKKFIALSSDVMHVIVIDGIVHDTFSDYAFVVDPVIQPWLIDTAAAHAQIIEHIGAFCDCYL